jgi:hypothetical protein
MKINDAINLRKEFKLAPFIHETKLENETYFTGSLTGNSVCSICGFNHTNAAPDEKYEWCKLKEIAVADMVL